MSNGANSIWEIPVFICIETSTWLLIKHEHLSSNESIILAFWIIKPLSITSKIHNLIKFVIFLKSFMTSFQPWYNFNRIWRQSLAFFTLLNVPSLNLGCFSKCFLAIFKDCKKTLLFYYFRKKDVKNVIFTDISFPFSV